MDPPSVDADLLESVLTSVAGDPKVPFARYLEQRLSTGWLEESDDRLGVTRFEGSHNEMIRRRRLRIDPGPVTILLHPMLRRDEALRRHTLAHELLHATGLMEHTPEHEALVKRIAPAPGLDASPLLRELRTKVLGELRRRLMVLSPLWIRMDAHDRSSSFEVPHMRSPLPVEGDVSSCSQRVHREGTWVDGWAYGVGGYPSGLLSRRPGFESWCARQRSLLHA